MKRPLLLFAFLVALTCVASAEEWKAGAAEVVITPRELMWMAGYASRTKPAEGKAQDLFAKALALEDASGNRAVIVTLDLIGIARPMRDRLAQRLQQERQVPAEAVMVNASHTHCGPEFRVEGRADRLEDPVRRAQGEGYARWLEEQMHAVALQALDHLEPARLSYHHARCGVSMNRRLPADGTFRNAANAEGPVDQNVPVLRVITGKDQVRAILFGYACHNTTMHFNEWCGDYAGYAQEYLEAEHPGTVALFVQGCAGDQNPYPRGKLEQAQFHGRALFMAVEAALTAPPSPLAGPLRASFGEVALDFAPQTDRAGFEARLKDPDKQLATHARRMLDRLDQEGALPTQYPYPVQVFHFGTSLTLVALAGETVVDYSLRLKRELTGPPLWVAGYSNDVMTYIPSKRVLEEGGYEGGGAMRFTHLPFPWADTVEERIVGKVKELVK